jgi:hypothetical protein
VVSTAVRPFDIQKGNTVTVTDFRWLAYPGIFDKGPAVRYKSIVPKGDVLAEGWVGGRLVIVSSRDEIEDDCKYDNNQTEEDQNRKEFEGNRTCNGVGKWRDRHLVMLAVDVSVI